MAVSLSNASSSGSVRSSARWSEPSWRQSGCRAGGTGDLAGRCPPPFALRTLLAACPDASRGVLKQLSGDPGVPRLELYVLSCPGCAPSLCPPHLRSRSPHCSRLKRNRRVLFLETAPCFFVSFIHAMPPPRRDSSAPLLRETGIPATPTLAPRSERAVRGLTREELRAM